MNELSAVLHGYFEFFLPENRRHLVFDITQLLLWYATHRLQHIVFYLIAFKIDRRDNRTVNFPETSIPKLKS